MQIRICLGRLRDLSSIYHRHLVAVLRSDAFVAGRSLSGNFSDEVFLSCHAFVSELSTLRDYITAFAGFAIYHKQNLGLQIFKRNKKGRSTGIASLDRMCNAAEEGNGDENWLHLLTEYRNLIVHNAPLAGSNGSVMIRNHLLSVGKDNFIPSVTLPLPNNPIDLRQRFAKGSLFQTKHEWAEATKNSLRDGGRDALDFCKLCFSNFCLVADDLITLSKQKPSPIVFDETNIIPGSLKISRG